MGDFLIVVLIILGFILLLVVFSKLLSKKYKLTFDNHYTPHVYNDFPDIETGNWLPQKHIHDYVYNEEFHYKMNKTIKEKLMCVGTYILCVLFAPLVVIIDGGAIYKNSKKLRKYRKQFKGKYITVSNHVYEYEYLMIRTMNYGKRGFVPIWQEGAEGPSGTFYRSAGGLVLPHSVKGLYYGYQELKKTLEDGKWIHIFPEQAGWFYYGGIRKFQPGTFKLAYETNTPIIPLGISFRKRKGIWRLFGPKNKPCVTLSVGDPIIPDLTKDKQNEVERLSNVSRSAVMNLANIRNEEENIRIKSEYNYYPYDSAKSSY